MLTAVTVINGHSDDLELVLEGDIHAESFQLHNINGLGPVTAQINTLPFGAYDGEFHIGSFVGKRNIVLTIGLNPDWATMSVADLRLALYAYFMPKSQVTLKFTTTNLPDVQINGYVESCEPNIFSKDPEIVISILCPEPSFVATEPTTLAGVVAVSPGGGIPEDYEYEIDYAGNIATGFKLSPIRLLTPESTPYNGEITINNVIDHPGVYRRELFQFEAAISTEYHVYFSSVSGEKFVRSRDVGSGIDTSILGAMTTDEVSVWPKFVPGINKFSVVSDSGVEQKRFDLEYYTKFGGL
jgi:hypothetical protein